MKRLKIAVCALMIQIGIPVIMSAAAEGGYSLVINVAASSITEEQVTRYLQENKHTVLSTPVSNDEGYTWTCKTSMDGRYFITTVYTNGEQIVDFEDIIIE